MSVYYFFSLIISDLALEHFKQMHKNLKIILLIKQVESSNFFVAKAALIYGISYVYNKIITIKKIKI